VEQTRRAECPHTGAIPVVRPGRTVAHRVVSRIAMTRPGTRFIRDVGDRIDPALLRITRGQLSSVWPFPAVLVTHIGARSNKPRTTALVYFTDRNRIILIATNFGAQRNPSWYYNMKANPIVEVYGRGLRGRFAAEEVLGPERDRLMKLATDAPGPYGKYQRAASRSNRCVPVIALLPEGN
jgi:deazaflavin-dependent oxidoreductase (nitroreductase family)